MKTGVSIGPWGSVTRAARARLCFANTSNFALRQLFFSIRKVTISIIMKKVWAGEEESRACVLWDRSGVYQSWFQQFEENIELHKFQIFVSTLENDHRRASACVQARLPVLGSHLLLSRLNCLSYSSKKNKIYDKFGLRKLSKSEIHNFHENIYREFRGVKTRREGRKRTGWERSRALHRANLTREIEVRFLCKFCVRVFFAEESFSVAGCAC